MCYCQTVYNRDQSKIQCCLRQMWADSAVSMDVKNPGNVSAETVSASDDNNQQLQLLYHGE